VVAEGRIDATYRIGADDVMAVADAIRVEQTIEFPFHLAPEWIQQEVVGQVVAREGNTVTIGFCTAAAADGFAQFLNVIWGNVSLFPGVRLVDVQVPDGLFAGPKFGVAGLRERLGVFGRPLLATALKPMGMSAEQLATMAGTLAAGGLDLIKDDHGLANQPWAPWRERVTACAAAVTAANDRYGTNAQYLPSLNVPIGRIDDAIAQAEDLGVGGLLVLPGVSGMDTLAYIAERSVLPIMVHPSFLGSNVLNPDQGLQHGVLFGDLMRLAGADISIFPNVAGRFSFTAAQCLDIRDRCAAPISGVAASWPAPGGGMQLDRIGEMRDFYGDDVVLLIGGALHDGDLASNVNAMVTAIRG